MKNSLLRLMYDRKNNLGDDFMDYNLIKEELIRQMPKFAYELKHDEDFTLYSRKESINGIPFTFNLILSDKTNTVRFVSKARKEGITKAYQYTYTYSALGHIFESGVYNGRSLIRMELDKAIENLIKALNK